MTFLPIEEHGVIGDLHTVALVGVDGTVDFLSWPDFDSPTVFASLLDPERRGHFTIQPEIDATRKQLYLFDTNVLLTRFLFRDGVVELTDFMVPGTGGGPAHVLVRRVTCVRGPVTVTMRSAPRFDYGRADRGTTPGVTGAWSSSRRGPTPSPCGCEPTSPRDGRSGRDRHGHARTRRDDLVRARVSHPKAAGPGRGEPARRRGVPRHRRLLASVDGPVATRAAGARPSTGRPSSSSCWSPTGTGRSWPRRRSACPRSRVASATGTTGTPGSGTPRSRSTHSSGWATRTRRAFHGLDRGPLP